MSKHRNRHQPHSPITPSSLVDIVIPVYNRSDLLKRCLEYIPDAIKDNSYTIYVFDNGSKIGGDKPEDVNEAAFIRQYCEANKAIYLRNGTNIGFPAACNRAARKGISPLIFFLSDDVFLMPDSLNKLILAMDDPTIGVAGMKLLFPLDSTDYSRPAGKIQHVGLSTNIRGEFFHQFVGWSPESPRPFKMKYPYAVTGAAMMTRRKLFKQIGGFFEGYGMGTYEDVDYCLAIRELRYNCYIQHEAVAFHLTGATAATQQVPFQLRNNADLFRLRWKDKIRYTEWENW